MPLNLCPHNICPVQYNGSCPCNHGSQQSQWGKSRYPLQPQLDSKVGFVESVGAVHKADLRRFCHDGFAFYFHRPRMLLLWIGQGNAIVPVLSLFLVTLGPSGSPSFALIPSSFLFGNTENLQSQPLVLSVFRLSPTGSRSPYLFFSMFPISVLEGRPLLLCCERWQAPSPAPF